MTDTVKLVADIQSAMETMKKDNSQVLASLQEANKETGVKASEATKKAEELAQKIAGVAASIVEMEQKLAENVTKGKAAASTLGEMVIKSDAFKTFAAGSSNRFRIEANTITGQDSASPPANSDVLVPSQRLPGIIPGAFRMLRVQDVLPAGVTSSNIVEYTKEASFTNNAAETVEGASKPESAITYSLVSAPVRTIAHFLKASKQVLEDAPMLQSYIDNRLRYGVELKYDNQLLNGDGTGQAISGITDSGNFTAFTPQTGANQLDSINRAIELVALADYQATAIMLNPADWHAIERLKVGTGDDRYIIGNPASIMGPTLWGLPVVVTNNLTSGKLLVGAFNISHQVFNRSSTVVEMFEQDDTNVQKNLVTIRAEKRGTLATFVPAAVYYGNLVL